MPGGKAFSTQAKNLALNYKLATSFVHKKNLPVMSYENNNMKMKSLWKCNEKVGNLRRSACSIAFPPVKPEIW